MPSITDPGVNLAIGHRSFEAVTLSLGSLAPLDDIAGEFAIATLLPELEKHLADAGYQEPDLPVLLADIGQLATGFAQIMDIDRVAIRLEIVDSDACRRFHADYVTARLICTYVGPGTQWLDDADAKALALGAAPETLTIRQIETGDVAIFKGRLWAPDAPAIHRSPPIAGTGLERLVLVVDPAPALPIAHG